MELQHDVVVFNSTHHLLQGTMVRQAQKNKVQASLAVLWCLTATVRKAKGPGQVMREVLESGGQLQGGFASCDGKWLSVDFARSRQGHCGAQSRARARLPTVTCCISQFYALFFLEQSGAFRNFKSDRFPSQVVLPISSRERETASFPTTLCTFFFF